MNIQTTILTIFWKVRAHVVWTSQKIPLLQHLLKKQITGENAVLQKNLQQGHPVFAIVQPLTCNTLISHL